MNLNESVNLEPRSYIYSFSSNNMAWVCFSVILVALALTSGVVFVEASVKPRTCGDVKLNKPAAGDGEYNVYPDAVGARRVRVYCHDMAGTPREYVTLQTPNMGVYPNLANKNCRGETEAESPEKTGQSIFNKIRVNIETMVIDPTDYTFADTEGVPVPYGEAKDCYSIHYGGHKAPCGIKGTFTINTAGTGLVIDGQTRWEAEGWNPYAEVTKSDEGEIINLLCGGWCGGCKADRDLKLTLNPNEAGLRTCSDVRAMDPNAGDGEYTLYPKILSGEGLQVYCDNMSENPREYLSLSVVNIGVSPDLSNVLCKEETESVNPADVGSSEFSKIRINTETLEVNQSDYRFATVSGHRVAYGRAHDCYTYEDYRTCGPKGFFVINTSGTGLRVNTTLEWILTGDSPSMNVTRSDHGAVIHLSCGGFCGGCIPIHQIFLEKNPEDFK